MGAPPIPVPGQPNPPGPLKPLPNPVPKPIPAIYPLEEAEENAASEIGNYA